MKRFVLISLVFAAIPVAVLAGKVKVWHHHAPGHYEKAELKGVVLTTEGAIRLARQVKPLAGIDGAHVWAVTEDKAGNLFVATGNEGKLFKVASDGAVTLAHTSEDSQILSLAAAADGGIYAGTGPTGRILHLAPDGTVKEIHSEASTYVWSLAWNETDKALYAGVGPKGRILKVSPDGKTSTFYTTKQDHVLCVLPGADGNIYAGTSKNGLVYRIDTQGKGFVLFDAPQSEVRTLALHQGGIFVGTSAASSRKSPGAVTVSRADRSENTPVLPATAVPVKSAENISASERNNKVELAGGPLPESSSVTSASTAPSTPPPSSKENSIYHVSSDGAVRELFREKTMMLTLMELNGKLLVGTGGDGQVFEIDPANRERNELARLDHTQVHCLFRRKDGSIVAGMGDPGKLYLLQNKFVSSGTVVSEVLDAKGPSRWGMLQWKCDTPAGTILSFAVRSGNVSAPDETWSNWSAEVSDPQAAHAGAPVARFLQYRATLKTGNDQVSPTLHSLALRYQTGNVAPEVGNIDVPNLDAVSLENPKKLKIKWSATDMNDDGLTYTLLYRKEGWRNWVELDNDLEKTEYEWDTTTTPAGVYQVRVVASDRRDNPAESALSGDRLSSPFTIDHVPPTVSLKVISIEKGKATVEASGNDELTRLVSAAFSVDSRKWLNVFPTSGLFDSKSEQLRFQTDALKPGTHVLVLRVTDAAGNTGSSDVVFTVPDDK